jgi:hypothetical protein
MTNSRIRYELRWIPHAVAKALASKGIHSRADLARAMGWPKSTTYRAFTQAQVRLLREHPELFR